MGHFQRGKFAWCMLGFGRDSRRHGSIAWSSTQYGLLYVFLYLLAIVTSAGAEELAELNTEAQGFGLVISLAITWVYYAVFESSSKQGTLGKLAVGIKVTDMHGNRIGVGIAIGRNFCKLFSMLIFFVGFIIVAFTKRKQGLHDITARCLVINRDAHSTHNAVDSHENSRID